MPVIKQKSLKPATTIPEAAGILAYNGSGVDIAKNDVVKISGGLQGSALKIEKASSQTNAAGGKVPLFVAKHAIPQGERGVILPWLIAENVLTHGLTAGNAIYLNNDAAGKGGWSGAKIGGAVDRMVGVVLTVSSGALILDGAVWLSPGMFTYGTD